jgi:hypothetical protein
METTSGSEKRSNLLRISGKAGTNTARSEKLD